jgi:hypothetical protein
LISSPFIWWPVPEEGVAPCCPLNPEERRHPRAWGNRQSWQLFGWAGFLVSVPVFIEAPLVRYSPGLSVGIACVLALVSGLGRWRSPQTRWQDVCAGFTLSWLAGAIYWGWFRGEPLLHLPIEALGVPLVLWWLGQRRWLLGSAFYLGSLTGTAITDLYCYLLDLIPYWRSVMRVDPDLGGTVLQAALNQMQSWEGLGWAIALALGLLGLGLMPIVRSPNRFGPPETYPWWIFAGAILLTLVVDGLFALTIAVLPT